MKSDNLVGLVIQIEIVIEIHSESHFVYNILTYIHNATYAFYFLVKTDFKGPNTIALKSLIIFYFDNFEYLDNIY